MTFLSQWSSVWVLRGPRSCQWCLTVVVNYEIFGKFSSIVCNDHHNNPRAGDHIISGTGGCLVWSWRHGVWCQGCQLSGEEHAMMWKIHFVYNNPLAAQQTHNTTTTWRQKCGAHLKCWHNPDQWWWHTCENLMRSSQTVGHSRQLTIIRWDTLVCGHNTLMCWPLPWWGSQSKHSQLMPCVSQGQDIPWEMDSEFEIENREDCELS